MCAVKGQGKYIIGIFVMIAAISIGMMGQFATEYVLHQAFVNMNENYARYESMTHSYMILNDGRNNVGNHSELNNDFDTSDCTFNSVGTDEGDRYEIAFIAASTGTDFADGDCTYTRDHYFEEPQFDSPYLFSSPWSATFPEMAYWSVGDGGGTGKSFYMHTRVTPESE